MSPAAITESSEHASGRITLAEDISNSAALDDDTRRELAQAFGITGSSELKDGK